MKMDAPPKDLPNFLVKFGRFKTLNQHKKDNIKKKSKAESTYQATRVWTNCFSNYLIEKGLPELDDIPTEELPNALENFYSETCKKKGNNEEYKNSTFKCIRAGINRHYKATRSLDIISDPRFIQVNEMFEGKSRVNKEEGHGEIESLPCIKPEDFDQLSSFFKEKMQGPPDPTVLQEIMVFNIIYYMGRRGRENLQRMPKYHFAVATDHENRRYVVLVKSCRQSKDADSKFA